MIRIVKHFQTTKSDLKFGKFKHGLKKWKFTVPRVVETVDESEAGMPAWRPQITLECPKTFSPGPKDSDGVLPKRVLQSQIQ